MPGTGNRPGCLACCSSGMCPILPGRPPIFFRAAYPQQPNGHPQPIFRRSKPPFMKSAYRPVYLTGFTAASRQYKIAVCYDEQGGCIPNIACGVSFYRPSEKKIPDCAAIRSGFSRGGISHAGGWVSAREIPPLHKIYCAAFRKFYFGRNDDRLYISPGMTIPFIFGRLLR